MEIGNRDTTSISNVDRSTLQSKTNVVMLMEYTSYGPKKQSLLKDFVWLFQHNSARGGGGGG